MKFTPCTETCNECIENMNNSCKFCLDNNQVMYNTNCVKNCPTGMKANSIGICIKCEKLNLFIYNEECVRSCPHGYKPDNKNICSLNLIPVNNSTQSIPCDINPCLNGGICFYNANKIISCNCSILYEGEYCDKTKKPGKYL